MKPCHLTIVSRNPQSINNFLLFIQNNIEPNFNVVKKRFQQKQKKKILTILKSPHVNKTAQEQFEYRVFSKQLVFYSANYLKHIILLKKTKANLFPDVKIKVKFVINSKNASKLRVKVLNPDNFKGNFYKNIIQPLRSKDLERLKFEKFKTEHPAFLKLLKKILKIKDVYGELTKNTSEKFG